MRELLKFLVQRSASLSWTKSWTIFRKHNAVVYHEPYRSYLSPTLQHVCLADNSRIAPCYYAGVRFYNKSNGRRQDFSDRKNRRVSIRETITDHRARLQKDVDHIQNAISDKTEKLKRTERRIRAKGKLIMKDIKETKEKMKEKMEEVIERENVYTIPNLLCVTRIVCSPLLGYLIIVNKYEYALAFMAVAGISDWVDGWIARNYKSQSSKIGSFLDPMADKVLIGTLFLTLTYVDLIPVALTALIIGRDVILVAAGFVIRYRSLPPPRTLSRYFDVTHATAQLAPTTVSKVNTGVQLLLVATTLGAPVFSYIGHPVLQGLWYITAASTVVAAASYILSKQTYRYLNSQNKH